MPPLVRDPQILVIPEELSSLRETLTKNFSDVE
jgi:hypothetical protein